MLYEYAIDPSLLSHINNCRTIFDNFKPERGKIIADVPKKWQQEAFQAINGIPHEQCHPVMRQSLKNGLKRLLNEVLCKNRQCPSWDRYEESWLAHVIATQGGHPFAAILASASLTEPIQTFALSQLFLDAPECWNAPTEIPVPRSAPDIVDALMPLFRVSKQIVLIDRHLYPGERRARTVLREIIRRVPEFNFGKGVSKITLHASDHRKDMKSSLEHYLLSYLPDGFEFVCCTWPKSMEHDRYAITDVGGVYLGEGFDERTHDGTDKVFMSLIGYTQRMRLLAKFTGQSPTERVVVRKP